MSENKQSTDTNDTNTALGTAGAGVVRILDGKEYSIMPMTRGMRGTYSAWMSERHRLECLSLEKFYMKEARTLRKKLQIEVDDLNEEEREEALATIYELEESARRQMSDHRKMVTAGEFHYTGDICQDSLRTHEGVAKHLLMMMQVKHPHLSLEVVTELLEKHGRELRDAMREANSPKKPHSYPEQGDGKESTSQA